MARKLASTVIIGDTAYEKGTEPPKEIAEQITNPAAWEEQDDPAAFLSAVRGDSNTEVDPDPPKPEKRSAQRSS